MRLITFILFLIHWLTPLAWAAPCEVKQVNDPSGFPRLATIAFPDGRRVTIVGQVHTDRFEMDDMLKLPDNKNLFSEVRKRVDKPNNRYSLALYEEERKLLYDAIVKEDMKFVGIELTEASPGHWLRGLREFQDRMLAYSARTGESDIELISKARLAVYGPALAMPLEQPALFLKARLIGIEDRDAVAVQAEAFEALKKARADLQDEMGSDKKLIAKLSRLDHEMMLKHYSHYDPNTPGINATIINPALSQWPKKYRQTLRQWLEAYVDFLATLFERDEHSTKNILAQNDSGIIFIGAAHLRPIMRRLKNTCLKDLPREDLTSSISAQAVR